jgi:hypothetical protein
MPATGGALDDVVMEWFELCDVDKAGQLFQSTTLRAQVTRKFTIAPRLRGPGVAWTACQRWLAPTRQEMYAGMLHMCQLVFTEVYQTELFVMR